MPLSLSLPLAQATPVAIEAGQPLFGNVWLALLAVLAGIAVLLVLVALLGRWLAATHPERPRRAAPVPVVLPDATLTTAIIAASVTAALGEKARVTSVQLVPTHVVPSVEMLMQQWSMEGRRQIYSSHKVR